VGVRWPSSAFDTSPRSEIQVDTTRDRSTKNKAAVGLGGQDESLPGTSSGKNGDEFLDPLPPGVLPVLEQYLLRHRLIRGSLLFDSRTSKVYALNAPVALDAGVSDAHTADDLIIQLPLVSETERVSIIVKLQPDGQVNLDVLRQQHVSTSAQSTASKGVSADSETVRNNLLVVDLLCRHAAMKRYGIH
jgi:hypothetical protein